MCKWVPVRAMPEVSQACQQVLLVQIVVAEATGVGLARLCGDKRGQAHTAFARQTAMYLCRVVYAMRLGDIALAFGRDRSTAGHAVRRIEEAREHPEFDRRLTALEAMLQNAGGRHD